MLTYYCNSIEPGDKTMQAWSKINTRKATLNKNKEKFVTELFKTVKPFPDNL